MKKFDCHIHMNEYKQNPSQLLKSLEKAGLHGGCIFSCYPGEHKEEGSMSFEDRLSSVMEAVKGYEDRLFPVMWIHPYEKNIIENIHIAVEKGIAAFKIICSNFYVYEEKSMEVLTEIAALGKPVFFHSGILWDGQVSSGFNRPVNWEALINIKGLRFSMGHCSWPWHDECIALYGKFLNALTVGEAAEMFLDITPGTPDIYREDLIGKIFTIGYDFGKNILFGTDCSSETYNSQWAEKWMKKDGEIMDKLEVGKRVRRQLYYDNLLRFLGKTEVKTEHLSPVPDNANPWSCKGEDTKDIIEHWYKKIGFDSKYDTEFYDALNTIKIPDYTEISTYDTQCTDGKKNLLSYLYMCEDLKEIYEEKGIPLDILMDNLKDISVWTDIWSEVKGELYLGELPWLSNHLTPRLFKIGRLQFCMGTLPGDIDSEGLKKGDPIMEIHIPQRGPLNYDECVESIERAKEFFGKYYPEFKYKCFTCDSWLLGKTPLEILNSQSNICRFVSLFKIIHRKQDDSILRYLFKWNTTWETIADFEAVSSFAKEVKERALKGEHFDEGFGIIKL